MTALADWAVTTPAGLCGPAATPIDVGSGGPLVSLPVIAVAGFEALPASSMAVTLTVIPSSGFGVSARLVASTGVVIELELGASVSDPGATLPSRSVIVILTVFPGESVVTATGTPATFAPVIGGTVTVSTVGREVSLTMFGPKVGPLVFPRLSEDVADTVMGPSASVPAPETGTITVAAPPEWVPDTDVPLVSVSVTVMVSAAVAAGVRSTGTPTLAPFWTSSKLMKGCGVTSPIT